LFEVYRILITILWFLFVHNECEHVTENKDYIGFAYFNLSLYDSLLTFLVLPRNNYWISNFLRCFSSSIPCFFACFLVFFTSFLFVVCARVCIGGDWKV